MFSFLVLSVIWLLISKSSFSVSGSVAEMHGWVSQFQLPSSFPWLAFSQMISESPLEALSETALSAASLCVHVLWALPLHRTSQKLVKVWPTTCDISLQGEEGCVKSGLGECSTFLFGMACSFQISTRTSLEFLNVFEHTENNPNLFRIRQRNSDV